jgi:hypothetical protein
MKCKVSLPEESKRAFFQSAGLPRVDRGGDAVEMDLEDDQRKSLVRKGLVVKPLLEEKKEKPKPAAKKSRREENE